ncbi:MAG: GIY-YIG nuclease family protein [bacterium]
MWFVYILKSLKDGRYYIGSTSDIEKRVERHNHGG